MTVSAVSTNYTYSSSAQYWYFGTSISDDEIERLMYNYGITKTGDADLDMKALKNAMYSKAESSAIAGLPTPTQMTAQIAQNAPWASLMSEVGLIATGNLDTDASAFASKITTMQESAKTPAEKANIRNLEAEASVLFVQEGQVNANEVQAPTASGADIMSNLNKLYFFAFG